MSRIFDALQRSESERADSDGGASPIGPELLQRAERRIASKWQTVAPVNEVKIIENKEEDPVGAPEALASSLIEIPIPAASDTRSAEERAEFLSRVRSIHVSLDPDSRLVCLTDRESPTAEAIRLLGVRLRDFRRSRPLKKVLITSTIPREGKTTLSANLACAIAHGSDEERTLLIGGDIRIPSLMGVFGIEKISGLCELVLEDRSLTDSIYYLEGAGIWVLPAGKVPSNPLEVLQAPRLLKVMDQLAACFDWIIIDSPPVLPLADTTIWMRQADGILLVTRQGTTEKRQLQRGLEALDPNKVLGALLNSAEGAAYGGYYYHSSNQS